MNKADFNNLFKSIKQARAIHSDTGGSAQRPILPSKKKKVAGTDRVNPKGTTKVSKEKNRGYSRSNTTGKDR